MTDQERQKVDDLIGRLETAVGQMFPRDGANAALITEMIQALNVCAASSVSCGRIRHRFSILEGAIWILVGATSTRDDATEILVGASWSLVRVRHWRRGQMLVGAT